MVDIHFERSKAFWNNISIFNFPPVVNFSQKIAWSVQVNCRKNWNNVKSQEYDLTIINFARSKMCITEKVSILKRSCNISNFCEYLFVFVVHTSYTLRIEETDQTLVPIPILVSSVPLTRLMSSGWWRWFWQLVLWRGHGVDISFRYPINWWN